MRTTARRRPGLFLDGTCPARAVSWLGIALAGLLFVALPLEASQVRPVNLEELTFRADRIFAGRCVETEVVAHPQLGSVTRVTFEVERGIKGDLDSTLTIEVVGDGTEAGGAAQRPGLAALDVPRFAPGERVVLFLYPDSSLGLTSPVALGQGKFSVLRDKEGDELAVNALGNRDLLRGLSDAAKEGVGASLMQWETKPGMPAEALLDGTEELLRLEARGTTREAEGRQEPAGGER